MDKDDIFHDYKLVCNMKAPFKIKVKMLTFLFSAQLNPWRVVGITEAALKVFKNYNFKKESYMGINRAHINGRNETYREMMNKTFKDCSEWWEFYYENDKTILAMSTENKKEIFSKKFDINEDLALFKNRGYSWTHNIKERDFLNNLYNKQIKTTPNSV